MNNIQVDLRDRFMATVEVVSARWILSLLMTLSDIERWSATGPHARTI